MTARQTWKDFERRLARYLGGRRIPVTGIDRDEADVVVEGFCCVQAKLRKAARSMELRDWLHGIRRSAAGRGAGETGILVWKRPGEEDRNALVILTLEDWIALHGASEDAESSDVQLRSPVGTPPRGEPVRPVSPSLTGGD